MRPGDRTSERGFTIVEVLIVITILSLVSLLANTSFRNFRERAILNRAARVVATDMALTRSLAIRERQNVSLVADDSMVALRNGSRPLTVTLPVRRKRSESMLTDRMSPRAACAW